MLCLLSQPSFSGENRVNPTTLFRPYLAWVWPSFVELLLDSADRCHFRPKQNPLILMGVVLEYTFCDWLVCDVMRNLHNKTGSKVTLDPVLLCEFLITQISSNFDVIGTTCYFVELMAPVVDRNMSTLGCPPLLFPRHPPRNKEP